MQKLNFTEKFADFSIRYEELNALEEITFPLMYVSVGSLCSNKVRAVEEFVFDFIMSFGHLVRAFMNEPLLQKEFFFLRCANKYAVEKKIWDISKYPINMKLSEEEMDKCESTTAATVAFLKEAKLDSEEDMDECEQKIAERLAPLVLKLALLTQVELSAEAKEVEKQNFITEENEVSEEAISCVFKLIKTVSLEDLKSLSDSEYVNAIEGFWAK